jgi:hypothetical protein
LAAAAALAGLFPPQLLAAAAAAVLAGLVAQGQHPPGQAVCRHQLQTLLADKGAAAQWLSIPALMQSMVALAALA